LTATIDRRPLLYSECFSSAVDPLTISLKAGGTYLKTGPEPMTNLTRLPHSSSPSFVSVVYHWPYTAGKQAGKGNHSARK